MRGVTLAAALAALCFTACPTSGLSGNTQPTHTTTVAANKENASLAVEAAAVSGSSYSGSSPP